MTAAAPEAPESPPVQEGLDYAVEVEEFLDDNYGESWRACQSCSEPLDVEPARKHLLIVDCRNGHDAAKSVRARVPKTRVLVLSRPRFQVGPAQLALADRALRAIARYEHDDPRTFRRGGQLVTVGRGRIEELSLMSLLILLAEVAIWHDRAGKPVDPPSRLARAILKLGSYPNLPELGGVVGVPALRPDGTFWTAPGYDAATANYYSPAAELDGIEAPLSVTEDEVSGARVLILDELLGDFPFVAPADRANAVAVFLLSFVRPVIHGPTPLHWIGAPEPGTGKGKLVDALLAAGCGTVASRPLPDSDNERRKALTTALREGVAAVKLDNVKGTVRSAALEAALTEARWTDRILGSSTSVDVPITTTWTLTANNATPGTDLKRRTVMIRLDAGVERPYRRTGPTNGASWRHPLPAWALENRADLVHAALVLVRWWVQQGRPAAGTGRMGSYESWEAVIGGVLSTAGIAGFLDNVGELDDTDDDERDDLTEFLALWESTYGDAELTSREVIDDGRLEALCGTHVGPHVGQWTTSALGAYLRSSKSRVANDLRLLQIQRRSASNAWKVARNG